MEQSQPERPGDPGESQGDPGVSGVPMGGPGGVPQRADGPVTPVGPGAGAGKRRRSWKTVLLVVASVLGVLCSGTVGYGLWWYNQETKPDRSAPDVVVDNYLRSYLVEKDPTVTGLYICSEPAQLAPMVAFRADIEAKEQQHRISIRVTWSALKTNGTGEDATVRTDIKRAISDNSESIIETWQFTVVDQDGWRVCSAQKVS